MSDPDPVHPVPGGRDLLATLVLLVVLCLLVAVPSPPEGAPEEGPIVFQSDRDGNWEIYLMNADGSGQARLTDDPAQDWLPRWMPTPAGAHGTYIVFVSNRDGGWHIYLVDIDAAPSSSSTPSRPPSASLSQRSPRLAQILERARLGEPVRLTGETQDNWDPAPSPDGRYLAFSALSGRQRDLFLLDLETGETVNLTQHPAGDWLPAWAPDTGTQGGRLVFVSDRDDNMEIYLLDLRSGQATNLTDHPANDWVPTWGPAAAGAGPGRIAFQSDRDGNWEIYVLDLVTGTQTNLTNHPADDWDPAWSPDATSRVGRLAFMSLRDGNREVYTLEVDGDRRVRRLTDNPAADKNPACLP